MWTAMLATRNHLDGDRTTTSGRSTPEAEYLEEGPLAESFDDLDFVS